MRASVRRRGDRPPRLTPQRQGAAASQASSSSPARVDRRQSIVSCFPRSTRPPIASSTTPSPSHSGARAWTQGNPIPSDSRRAQARQADKRSAEPSRPSKDDAHGRASRQARPGRRPPATAQEDRARRPSIPSGPDPMTARGRTAHQTPHQRPPEAAGGARGRQATRDSSRPRQSGRRPHKGPRSPANQPKRQEQEAHKGGGPPPS